MSEFDVRKVAVRASGLFSYILLYAPRFPEEDQTDTKLQCDKLVALLEQLRARTKSEDNLLWLRLAVDEVGEALEKYEAGDEDGGAAAIQKAQDHFKGYVQGRTTKVTFVAGPGGVKKT